MLSHRALAQFTQLPSSLLPAALQLFSFLDLSLPRALHPPHLDHSLHLPAGRSRRLLTALEKAGILIPLGRRGLWRLAPEFTWSPRSLAEQWQGERERGEREEQARGAR